MDMWTLCTHWLKHDFSNDILYMGGGGGGGIIRDAWIWLNDM